MDDALVEKVARAINPTPWSLKDYGLPLDEFAEAALAMSIHRARDVLALPDLRLAGVKEGLEMAAKVAGEQASILSLASGHDDDEARADRWYEGGITASRLIATAIRSRGPRP